MGLFARSYHRLCEDAIRALEAGAIEGASGLLLKAIEKDPSQPRAFSWLGRCYMDAADQFWRRGDLTNQREYLELAIKAFGDAISRESNPEMKAEFWWQKASCLRLLGRDDSTSLQEADKAVHGFTEKRQQENMRELEQAFHDIAAKRDK